MKFFKKHASKFVVAFALTIVGMNVNQSCLFILNQPELPEGAKKLRKF